MAAEAYGNADNMTLQLSALSCLLRAGKGEAGTGRVLSTSGSMIGW